MVTVEEFVQQPLFLLLVGAGITGVFIPWFTKRWQDNKTKTKIRLNLTQEMSEINAYATGKILTAIATYKHSAMRTFSDDDAAQLYKEFETWHTKSSVLTSKLNAYFPKSDIGTKWADYSALLVFFWELVTRIYNTPTSEEEQIANNFIEDQVSIWKGSNPIQIHSSLVKNRDIKQVEELTNKLREHGRVNLISAILNAPMRKI